MLAPDQFVAELKKNKYTFFTGVPCSFFQAAINIVLDDKELNYTIAPNEGSALALAAGAALSGKRAVVMIQNSGLGNLINPLTSLNMIYKLPTLIFASGRAYGVSDEPQHEIIGASMVNTLQAIGVPYQDLPVEPNAFSEALVKAGNTMHQTKLPFFFLVKKGTFSDYKMVAPVKKAYPMKRLEAIATVTEALNASEFIVSTTGKPSRELFSVADRPTNFYMQGSMGHAASIGLGIALSHQNKKIVVLDGDGALIMHMGILSSIGFYKPTNFYHIVLDNESYESTGDQDTTSPTTDFVSIAKASGYRFAKEVKDKKSLQAALKTFKQQKGPGLLRVKINREPTGNIPRVTDKYNSAQITDQFQNKLRPDAS